MKDNIKAFIVVVAAIALCSVAIYYINGPEYHDVNVVISDFNDLKQSVEDGNPNIEIAGTITVTETIHVPKDTTIATSSEAHIVRGIDFVSDMFVVGDDWQGKETDPSIIIPSLKFETSGNGKIIIDGNSGNMKGTVIGSAILGYNFAHITLGENCSIIDCKKTGNKLTIELEEKHGNKGIITSYPENVGGAAITVCGGSIFDLDGGTIRNCTVLDDKIETTATNGGAIYNFGLTNLNSGTVEGCSADKGGVCYNYRVLNVNGGKYSNNHTTSYGAAFYSANSQYTAININQDTDERTVFDNNDSNQSGGVIFSNKQSSLLLSNGDFTNNNTGGNGGCINTSGVSTITNCTFSNNVADSKGGCIYAYYNNSSTIRSTTVTSCTFENNAAERGGAMAFGTSDDTKVPIIKIDESVFKGNTSTSNGSESYNGSGGALYISGADMTISSTKFESNKAIKGELNGGRGGTMYITHELTKVIISNSSIDGSSGDCGGAIMITGASSLTLDNVSIKTLTLQHWV